MKKVLMVIHDLRIGGAQKSLVSFLHAISGQCQYEISLLVIDPAGEFMTELPETVKLLEPSGPLRWLGSSLDRQLICKHFSAKGLWGELNWLVQKKWKKFPKTLNLQQKLWLSWKNRIPQHQEHYDVAVAYMDGVPGYYVMDKVHADKKILWVHSQYQKQGYDPAFDRPFFERSDGIITISEVCRDCICKEFPDYAHKVHILENITDPEAVLKKSTAGTAPEWEEEKRLKLLTVARLNPQKGVDLAISAAAKLRQKGVDFLWLVAGEGPQRLQLQEQIDSAGLQDCFRLLGNRENPYPYMRQCDIVVQPSRVEGRSMVADEAKVLCKPIVATEYATVHDVLAHGKTGWIVEMTPDGIAEGIETLWKDAALCSSLTAYLQTQPKGNREQLQLYMEIML